MADTSRFCLQAAAILGAVGVAAGAFGAHALGGRVSPERLAVFETGVHYLLFHVPALLGVGLLARTRPGRWLEAAGQAFFWGIVVFAGSLFALVLLDLPWLGAVTPLGGLMLIAGWLALAIGVGRVD